jgi:hypothetical protein
MKLTQFSLGIAIVLAGVAGAASSYKVMLPSDLSAGDTQLKAGEYTLTLVGKQVVFKKGKESIEVPATVEKNDKKFRDTRLEVSGTKLQSIDIGGTDMMIMFRPPH